MQHTVGLIDDPLDRRRIPMDERRTTLFIRGISPFTSAKDLGKEFAKFGQLLRCDVPLYRGMSKGCERFSFRMFCKAQS